jgi:NAD(P)-dependent dehydrogenase (short-subunit alcohol dehydrogenase family)
VGAGVLAHGHAVVAGAVAERVVHVAGPAEAGGRRPCQDAFLDSVGEVHPLAAYLLRSVAVGFLEDVYDAGSSFEPGRVLGAGGYVVGVAGLVGPGLAAHGQVQAAGDDYAPLGAVGVGRHLEFLGSAEEDRLAVGTREEATLEPREGRVHPGEILYPSRKRVHDRSSSDVCVPCPGVIILALSGVEEAGGAMDRLEGKRAIVTGAGAGIGRAIALRLAAEGARVALADVDESAAVEVAAEIEGETLVRLTDVTKAGEVEALVSSTVEAWGGLDVMVNNAGVGVAATAVATTEEDYDRVMDVCVRGTLLGIKYAIPAIRSSGGGSLINMSSVAALVGIRDRAVYSAAKGAILSLTRAAAMDHVEEGVRVNCIAPGTVDTPWISRITAGYADPDEARTNMEARQPHNRFVTPEEIAAMAAYLASDESASCIGACMIVDGGVTAR